jgi:dTDP-4-amino-4,6-dideoxygalactose transaminase
MGDVNAFSFCQDKIMSTGGEGGILTTNDSELRVAHGRSKIMERASTPYTSAVIRRDIDGCMKVSAQTGG